MDRDRYHLWANHGHAVHEDDDEMRCTECHVDYKRDDLNAVIAAAAKARAAWEAWKPPQKGKRRGTLVIGRVSDPKFAPQPICTICQREDFSSWKEAFDHMGKEHPRIEIWWHKPFAWLSSRMIRFLSRMNQKFQPKYRGARS